MVSLGDMGITYIGGVGKARDFRVECFYCGGNVSSFNRADNGGVDVCPACALLHQDDEEKKACGNECPDCGGEGIIFRRGSSYSMDDNEWCAACRGKGYIPLGDGNGGVSSCVTSKDSAVFSSQMRMKRASGRDDVLLRVCGELGVRYLCA